jgi:hypothetical protein
MIQFRNDLNGPRGQISLFAAAAPEEFRQIPKVLWTFAEWFAKVSRQNFGVRLTPAGQNYFVNMIGDLQSAGQQTGVKQGCNLNAGYGNFELKPSLRCEFTQNFAQPVFSQMAGNKQQRTL